MNTGQKVRTNPGTLRREWKCVHVMKPRAWQLEQRAPVWRGKALLYEHVGGIDHYVVLVVLTSESSFQATLTGSLVAPYCKETV